MDDSSGLVCSLTPDDLAGRRRAWEDLAPAVVDRIRTDDGFRVRFRRTAGVLEALTTLVEAERDCCAWASWALSGSGDHVVLDVTGPAEKMVALAAAFGV